MPGARAAMILCAGLGTRLRPLTEWTAKPMVPIGDAPAVAHVARQVRLATSRIVVNVHHRPEDVAAWAAAEGVEISRERELLGTAGGLARAADALGEGDVLVWNGDIVSAFDPRALIAAHGASPSLATLAVRTRPRGEGNVGLDHAGRVVRLRRETFAEESSGGEFLGIHVVGGELRALSPDVGCLVGDVYLPALRRGGVLRAFVTDAGFHDVGTIAAYLSANRAWLGARSSWAGDRAEIRARIDGSLVGARARVHADARRCVVWPDTLVTAPLEDAIATPFGVVPAQSR